jgi:cell division protein FtsB
MNWEKYFEKKTKKALIVDCIAYAKNNEEFDKRNETLHLENEKLKAEVAKAKQESFKHKMMVHGLLEMLGDAIK